MIKRKKLNHWAKKQGFSLKLISVLLSALIVLSSVYAMFFTKFDAQAADSKAKSTGADASTNYSASIGNTPSNIYWTNATYFDYLSDTELSKSLIDNQGTVNTSDYTKAALKLGDYGVTNNVFGYITAQSIGMKLPIYLGANNSMMSICAAHMCNTSLPVNMSDTNCSIAGHTGYRGRVFF